MAPPNIPGSIVIFAVRARAVSRAAFIMSGLAANELTVASCHDYRTLLAVAEAIISPRDLHALFHDLADRLHRVVRFDYLILVLHDGASNTMRRHILEPSAPIDAPSILPVEEGPSGWVWQTQQPLIIANLAEETRWPRLLGPLNQTISSLCYLALTPARHRLGALGFASKQIAAYDPVAANFPHLAATQPPVPLE